ncbi:MAG: D-alanyl-D-alanine carboxypeptidase [Candidatus Spechtbacteria bacterium]|nr:D-alanyl-D-alanine carboxypeptidase [Candidatus Spechtbacteria bacterium]
MRYIILFLIAILLPVFAFLNFNQYQTGNGPDLKNQAASVSLIASGENGSGEASSTASIELRKASANTRNIIFVGEENTAARYEEKIPAPSYSEPVHFPVLSAIREPYLERFKNPSFLPIRKWDVQIEDVHSASALVIEPATQKVLYHKNLFDVRPIASLTKLMTALIVSEEMDLTSEVTVSKDAVDTEGEAGNLVVDEKITVENLLYLLLVVSSNDAAVALEEYYNSYRTEQDKTFVAAMNRRAEALGLSDTFFVEPSGLNINNRSTAYDLARLADYVFQKPILRQVMSTQTIDVRSVDGVINHHLVNSNKLLGVLEGVLAGKTGFTDEAGESIVLFVKKGDKLDDYLIYVILGSDDRVKVARALIDWVRRAYVWE